MNLSPGRNPAAVTGTLGNDNVSLTGDGYSCMVKGLLADFTGWTSVDNSSRKESFSSRTIQVFCTARAPRGWLGFQHILRPSIPEGSSLNTRQVGGIMTRPRGGRPDVDACQYHHPGKHILCERDPPKSENRRRKKDISLGEKKKRAVKIRNLTSNEPKSVRTVPHRSNVQPLNTSYVERTTDLWAYRK